MFPLSCRSNNRRCESTSILFSTILLLLFGCGWYYGVDGLKLLQVQVPTEVERGRSAVLGCRFEMEGDTLYSVKWYKGGKEFFRVVPKDNPPAQTFNVEGVQVNLAASDQNQVVLENLNLKSEGRYKCEVSAESPNFQTVYDVAEMSVVVPPRDSPVITSPKTVYRIGEEFMANCSSFPSRPPATITWTIADKPVTKEELTQYPSTLIDGGLEASVVGLHLKLRDAHFDRKGKMKLTCTASVGRMRIDGRTVVNISIADASINGDYPRQRSLTLDSRSGANAGIWQKSEFWRFCPAILFVVTLMCQTFG
ncbi:uncharacterized protein LOC116925436 [Daphnia magna]|nr:uncharacterized protein LOC116925436 [Daphnia magna]